MNDKLILKEIGQRIKIIRINKGLTLEYIAKKAGYRERGAIGHIEAGDRDVSITKLILIAKALDVTPGELLAGEYSDALVIRPKDRLIEQIDKLNEEDRTSVCNIVKDFLSKSRYKTEKEADKYD